MNVIEIVIRAREEVSRVYDSILGSTRRFRHQLRDELHQTSVQLNLFEDDNRHAAAAIDEVGDSSRRGSRDVALFGRNANNTGQNVRNLAINIRGLIIAFSILLAQPIASVLLGVVGALGAVAASAGAAGIAIGSGLVAGISLALPVIGAFRLALQRLGVVMDAVKAAETARLNAQEEGRNRTEQLHQATRSLTQAEEAADTAATQLSRARRAQASAEKDLVEARREAARKLQDEILGERQATLDVADANLRVLEAKERLKEFEDRQKLADNTLEAEAALREAQARLIAARVQGDQAEIISGESAVAAAETALNNARRERTQTHEQQLEHDRLELGVRQAVLDKEKAITSERRASSDATKARAQGVEGSDTVRNARERLRTATEQVTDAERNLHDAQDNVREAQHRLRQETDNLSSSQQNLQERLADLSPAERRLFNSIRRLQQIWRTEGPKLTQPITEAMTHGIQVIISFLGDPRIIEPARRLFRTIGNELDALIDRFSTPEMRNIFGRFIDRASERLPGVADGFGDIAEAVINIADSSGAVAILDDILDRVEKIAQRFLDWTRNPDAVDRVLRPARQHLDAWLDLAGAVFDVMQAIAGPAAQTGLTMLRDLEKATRDWAQQLRDNPEGVQRFFENSRRTVGALASVIRTIAVEMNRAFDPASVEAITDILNNILIPAFADAAILTGQVAEFIERIIDLPFVREILRFTAALIFFRGSIALLSGLLVIVANRLILLFQFMRRHPLFLLISAILILDQQFGILDTTFGKVAATLGVVAVAMRGLFLANPWVAVIYGIITAVVLLETKFHFLQRAVQYLKQLWDSNWGDIRETTERFIQWFTGTFLPAARRVINIIVDTLRGFVDFLDQRVWPVARRVFEDIGKAIVGLYEHVIKPTFDLIKSVVSSVWDDFAEQFRIAFRQFQNIFKLFDDLIHGRWGAVWGDLKDIVRTALQGVLNVFDIFANALRGVWNWIVDKIGVLPDSWKIDAKADFSSLLEDRKDPAQGRGRASGSSLAPGTFQGDRATGGLISPVPGGVYRVAEAGHPEMVVPLDPSKRDRAMELVQEIIRRHAGDVPAMAFGGIAGSAIDEARGALRTATAPIKGALDFTVGKLKGLIGGVMRGILREAMPLLLDSGSEFYTTGLNMVDWIWTRAKGAIPGLAEGGIPINAHPGEWVLNGLQQMKLAEMTGISPNMLMRGLFGHVPNMAFGGEADFPVDTRPAIPGFFFTFGRSMKQFWDQFYGSPSEKMNVVNRLREAGVSTPEALEAQRFFEGRSKRRLGLSLDDFKNYLFSNRVFTNAALPYSVASTDSGLGNISWSNFQSGGVVGSRRGSGGKIVPPVNLNIQTSSDRVDIDYVMRSVQMHVAGMLAE